MTKDVWGPRGWFWLHTTAIRYRPSPENTPQTYRQLLLFIASLPCAACRVHAAQYIAEHPPCLACTHAFQAWSWRFHNHVNQRLGKPQITYDMYQRLYGLNG